MPAMGLLVWVKLTAYVADCDGCSGVMANGQVADHTQDVVASSKAWPLGTCFLLLQDDGSWKQVEVTDRLGPRTRRKAGASRHLDLLVGTKAEARAHGAQQVLAMPAPCECPL
jgi:3D (Asp-Asp-Asp) domain-containing protein